MAGSDATAGSATNNIIIALGAFNVFIAIAAGAFAAHGLKNILSADAVNTFKTAADYQTYHGIGLILAGILGQIHSNRGIRLSALLMFTGIVLFSGSLYILAVTGIKWLGAITPFGGVCFLAAWLILGFTQLSGNKQSSGA